MEKIPKHGQHMTFKKWKRYVKDGDFIDDDGFGKLATKKEMSSILVHPSEVKTGEADYLAGETFTHIVWFNR